MAKIFPFKGWRYNPDIIDRIEDVFVPPYDVITSEEQDQYYNKSPHSYIRINLNSAPGNEKYFSAATTLNMWIGSGVLIEEDQPAIYIFSQSFTVIPLSLSINTLRVGLVVLPTSSKPQISHPKDLISLLINASIYSLSTFL